MTGLDEIRAAQHMEIKTQSDYALEDYLAELDPKLPPRDLLPHTDVELRHLEHIRHAA